MCVFVCVRVCVFLCLSYKFEYHISFAETDLWKNSLESIKDYCCFSYYILSWLQ